MTPDEAVEYADARAACGLEGRYRIHDLRHSALTNLAASGANPIAIMGTAGHRSMSTTRQYVHLAGIVFRTEADALADRLLGYQKLVPTSANPWS